METNLAKKLIEIAKKYVGVTEHGGDNKGPEVEMFQKAVDGKAQKESWCMAFVQYCVKSVKAALPDTVIALYPSEHCMTVWNSTDHKFRLLKPEVGCVVIWQHMKNGKPTPQGHTGIVTEIKGDMITFETVEGNTGPSAGEIEREGDGVYLKKRTVKGTANMKVVGYLKPFVE